VLPTELLAQADCPPTHFYVPEGARFTLADEVADLMEAIGYQVGPEERLACHALYAQRPDGNYVGLDAGIVGPRQNLKTATGLAGALHDTFVQGIDAGWTSHEFKTSTAAFRDVQGIVEANTWLSSEVLKIRTGSVDPGFELRNGARLDIIARTNKSGRGMARPRLYLDEALYLTGAMMGAIVPTMSAMPNAHMVIASSPGLFESAILRGYRLRGRSGTDPHIGWIEWSQEQGDCASLDCDHQPETEGCWLNDMAAVLRVNPAAPRRISMDYLTQERRTLAAAPEEYLRERMGVWSDPPDEGAGQVFPVEAWAACKDVASEILTDAPVVLGVDVSWDRAAAHVAACGLNDYGVRHAQLVHTCDPAQVVDWLRATIAARTVTAIAVQATGAPVSSLLPDLERLGVPVVAIAAADIPRACGHAYDAVASRSVRHPGQSNLDRALAVAETRTLSDGWALDRKRSRMDIAPLVAWVHALWAASTFDGPPETEFFILT
jgi:hypothetical protein